MRSVLTTLVNAALLVWLLLGPLCWILRDGLGPNSVDSSGWQAIWRFLLTFYWGPICLVLLGLWAWVPVHGSRVPKGQSGAGR